MPNENPDTSGLTPFEKGQTGNPNGRPKGRRNLSTILQEMLDEDIEVTEKDGTKTKKKFADVIVRKLLRKANDGDLRAITEIFDRTEGKSKQTIQLGAEDSNTLKLEIVKKETPQPPATDEGK